MYAKFNRELHSYVCWCPQTIAMYNHVAIMGCIHMVTADIVMHLNNLWFSKRQGYEYISLIIRYNIITYISRINVQNTLHMQLHACVTAWQVWALL